MSRTEQIKNSPNKFEEFLVPEEPRIKTRGKFRPSNQDLSTLSLNERRLRIAAIDVARPARVEAGLAIVAMPERAQHVRAITRP